MALAVFKDSVYLIFWPGVVLNHSTVAGVSHLY